MADSRDLILAIDNGTQSVRALLFDRQGNLLVKVTRADRAVFFHRTGAGGARARSFLAGVLPGLPGSMGNAGSRGGAG